MNNTFAINNLTISYGHVVAVQNVSINIPHNLITAVIGPSGCGKSSFLRALNRMNDLVLHAKIKGEVLFH